MSTARHQHPISVTDYLEGENLASTKHESVDGVVYAMAGATVTHNRIATNATGALYSQLRGQRCQAFNSDMKVRIRQSHSTRFYYPDLSVVCQPNLGDQTFQDNPVVIVEVISESTRRVGDSMSTRSEKVIYRSTRFATTYCLNPVRWQPWSIAAPTKALRAKATKALRPSSPYPKLTAA
jgi:Uma2 family endonuclease